jgi:integrase
MHSSSEASSATPEAGRRNSRRRGQANVVRHEPNDAFPVGSRQSLASIKPLDNRSIHAKKMKMRRPHRVPLAPQALAILRELQEITGGSKYLFPSVRSWHRPISDNTLNAALRRLGYDKTELTTHGLRSTASTLLNESGKWHADAIERQLAHQEANEIRGAYTHAAEFWQERVRMMRWWADELDRLRELGRVIKMRA